MTKTKRALLMSALALTLCVSMLIGSTFAWFTDSVSSVNNIIKSGNLDVELEYYNGTNWEAVDAETNVFEENTLWEPGHTEVVYLKVSNLGTLALKYNLGINIVSEIESINVAGEPLRLSDYIKFGAIEDVETPYADRDAARAAVTDAKGLSTGYTKVGKMEAGADPKYVALVVYMPETVGNEANYRTGEVAPEIKLGINLMATQYTYEKDSFDNRYDGEAFIPVADVDSLGAQTVTLIDDSKLDLDASFSFKTTEDKVAAAASGYRYWHADFVVSVDKTVKANSLALAGYYDAYAQITHTVGQWIALQSAEDVEAGTEIRLMELMGVSGNYEELCAWIPEFLCGVADLSDNGANAGTTLTVELRLYETTIYSGAESGSANIETGKYITIGTYKHTIGGKKVSTVADLENALATGGNFVLANDIAGNVTVAQAPGVKSTIDGNGHNFAGVLLVDGKSGTYTTAGITIKNVNFVADSIDADACIQLGNGDNNTRYTCNVTVENCTFDVPGAVGVKSYTGGDKNLTITGCTATARAHSLVQAKGIDGVLVENCKVYSKNGLNFNNSDNVTVSGCTVDVKGYAVRFGESSGGVGAAETYLIKDCALKSACDDGDAVIVLRGTADYATLTIKNTTLTGTIEITNTAIGATVVK